TINITPPIIVTKKIAIGIVLFGLIVSSDNVVTASNPKKDKQRIAAPAKTREAEPSGLKNGTVEKSVPAPFPLNKPAIEKIIKEITKITWNEINVKFTPATTLIPRMFTSVTTKTAKIVQSHTGSAGNSAFK